MRCTPLLAVSHKGYIEIVKFLVDQGADIEAKNKYGDIPLIWASFKGYIDIVKFLVEQGANLEVKNYYGETPLILASRYGYIEIIKFLIKQGADIEAKDYRGNKFIKNLKEDQKEEIGKIINDIQLRKAMIKPCKKRYLSGI